LFPLKNTSLYISAIGELAADGSFITPIDDLLALRELVDQLSGSHDV
jgi:hypothetical protein